MKPNSQTRSILSFLALQFRQGINCFPLIQTDFRISSDFYFMNKKSYGVSNMPVAKVLRKQNFECLKNFIIYPLLAIDGCWGEGSQFSSGIQPPKLTHVLADAPRPLHILCSNKKQTQQFMKKIKVNVVRREQ